ncbi:hypothetical protein MT378_20535, partial [Psychrobacter sp. 16-Bac2893]
SLILLLISLSFSRPQAISPFLIEHGADAEVTAPPLIFRCLKLAGLAASARDIVLTELLVVACVETETNDNENKALAIKPLNKLFEILETGNRRFKIGKFSIITSA